jgi:hypothetical protein
MTIWNPDHRRLSIDSLRAALGYAAAAVLSITVWVVLASIMA